MNTFFYDFDHESARNLFFLPICEDIYEVGPVIRSEHLSRRRPYLLSVISQCNTSISQMSPLDETMKQLRSNITSIDSQLHTSVYT